MPRVICKLPNAGDEISGVKFHPLDSGGKISDEIDQNLAELFASIPGYELDEGEQAPPAPSEPPPAPKLTKKEQQALDKRAKEEEAARLANAGKAEQEEAERLAAEEAARVAAEQEAARLAAENAANNQPTDEVF